MEHEEDNHNNCSRHLLLCDALRPTDCRHTTMTSITTEANTLGTSMPYRRRDLNGSR